MCEVVPISEVPFLSEIKLQFHEGIIQECSHELWMHATRYRGHILQCRHPAEAEPGWTEWETLPEPQEGEAIYVPVGSQLRVKAAVDA